MSDTIAAPVILDERPKLTRVRVNPYAEHFPIDEGAKAWTFPTATDADVKAMKRAISQMRAAGRDADRTTKFKIEEADGSAQVIAWTVPKITHKPADKPAPAAAKKTAAKK